MGILDFLFGGEERERRHLNRDAPAIIEAAVQGMPPELVRDIASKTDHQLSEAQGVLLQSPESRSKVLTHFGELHRDARKRGDQLGLTAYTLIIIYLRADNFGEACAPARKAIDEFVEQWSPEAGAHGSPGGGSEGGERAES